jgi:8-oxo-dGTP pyrophosphatase MutT (NUDIX family)
MPRRSAGATLVSQNSGRVLLLRRSVHVPYPGIWSVPAGGIDPGESAVHAAIRELSEEAGYSGQLSLLCEERDGYFINFGFEVPREFRVRLNWENDACGWFDPTSLPRPVFPGLAGFIAYMLS